MTDHTHHWRVGDDVCVHDGCDMSFRKFHGELGEAPEWTTLEMEREAFKQVYDMRDEPLPPRLKDGSLIVDEAELREVFGGKPFTWADRHAFKVPVGGVYHISGRWPVHQGKPLWEIIADEWLNW